MSDSPAVVVMILGEEVIVPLTAEEIAAANRGALSRREKAKFQQRLEARLMREYQRIVTDHGR